MFCGEFILATTLLGLVADLGLIDKLACSLFDFLIKFHHITFLVVIVFVDKHKVMVKMH